LTASMTYAGDDPVNQSDPSGDCVSTPFGCVGPGPANGLNWDAAADAVWGTIKSAAAGFVGQPDAGTVCSGWDTAAYDAADAGWWVTAIGGLLGGGVTGAGNGAQEVTEQEGELPALTADQSQLEAKFVHAPDFGVTESRGATGFQQFGKVLSSFVDDPSTVRTVGRYRGSPVILNYNPSNRLVVVQAGDGSFISGWQMSAAQLQNVIQRRSLGGG